MILIHVYLTFKENTTEKKWSGNETDKIHRKKIKIVQNLYE